MKEMLKDKFKNYTNMVLNLSAKARIKITFVK